MSLLHQVPVTILRPLPANAGEDPVLFARIDLLSQRLPESLSEIDNELNKVSTSCVYDAAVNQAVANVWVGLQRFFSAQDSRVRVKLLRFARDHMIQSAQMHICRRLVKDVAWRVRKLARRLIKRIPFEVVALPLTRDGEWNATGWMQGIDKSPLFNHKQGELDLERFGLPIIRDLKELRESLGISSAKQLGYFLLATDAQGGPYTRFSIAKRNGSERVICAPKKQLRQIQRRILDNILAKVSLHRAAHGFVPGRSTATNASHHCKSSVLVKFDLVDFFPTIHYHRVVGVFASLGYHVADGRFGVADDSNRVAPTLARLCCYASDSAACDGVVLPQGAPTSPALSNIICRRLDTRLEGLAKRSAGVYSRYADDLTFSFDESRLDLGRFRWWIDQICHQEGFFVNHAKFRVIRASQRQVVTGIVVNDGLRVPREVRRRLRAILHNCRVHGVASQSDDPWRFVEYLRGLASYISMVNPEEGQEYLRQVAELMKPDGDEADESEKSR